MKKSIFLSFIFILGLAMCTPQAMAQKQSRIEKLLEYLNENDLDKWHKSREKLDQETQAYYAEELSLIDTLHVLWNKRSEPAATKYFGLYERAVNSHFPEICQEEKIELTSQSILMESLCTSMLGRGQTAITQKNLNEYNIFIGKEAKR